MTEHFEVSIHKCISIPPTAKLNEPYPVVIQFTLADRVGSLDSALHVFREHGVSLSRIESRPCKARDDKKYDFIVDFNAKDQEQISTLEKGLATVAENIIVMGVGVGGETTHKEQTPWFPRKLSDLDGFSDKVLEMGEELCIVFELIF